MTTGPLSRLLTRGTRTGTGQPAGRTARLWTSWSGTCGGWRGCRSPNAPTCGGDAVERLGGLRSRLNGQNAIANLEDAVWTLATTPRRGDTSERERCDEWEVTYRRNVLIDDFNARREAECTTPLSEVLNQRSHNAPYPT